MQGHPWEEPPSVFSGVRSGEQQWALPSVPKPVAGVRGQRPGQSSRALGIPHHPEPRLLAAMWAHWTAVPDRRLVAALLPPDHLASADVPTSPVDGPAPATQPPAP